MTSFEVVKRLRSLIGIRKIGHAGVLDKPATGLLICATGRATKLLPIFEEGYKIYDVGVVFGIRTDTHDITGKIIERLDEFELSEDRLREVLDSFQGSVRQKVPLFSNVKVKGKRLYKYALSNEKVEVPEREVFIYGITLHEFSGSKAKITVKCSRGTYIRTLIDDIGKALGVYAAVGYLRRVYSHPFHVSAASSIDEFKCISIEEALEFLPAIRVEHENEEKILNGVPFDRLFDVSILNKGLYRVLVGKRLAAVIEKGNRRVKYRFISLRE